MLFVLIEKFVEKLTLYQVAVIVVTLNLQIKRISLRDFQWTTNIDNDQFCGHRTGHTVDPQSFIRNPRRMDHGALSIEQIVVPLALAKYALIKQNWLVPKPAIENQAYTSEKCNFLSHVFLTA